jgi:hypothetical protein
MQIAYVNTPWQRSEHAENKQTHDHAGRLQRKAGIHNDLPDATVGCDELGRYKANANPIALRIPGA